MQLILSIDHGSYLLLLQNFQSRNLQGSAAEDVQKWLDFIVEVKEFIIPDLSLDVCSNFGWHLMSDDGDFDFELCLRSVLVSWGFVGEGFDILVSEYFDIGPPVGKFHGIVLVSPGVHLDSLHACVFVGHFDIFGGDDGRVGVSPDDSLVPHEIVVDELDFLFFLGFGLFLFVLVFGFYHFGGGCELL